MALLRWAKTAVPTATGAPVFAVVDVETTGLSPSHHRILELAVIRTDAGGRVVDEWTGRFNPEGPVGATHIHGITDADVADAPLFSATASEVAARMAGLLPVAHNARFDLAFLREEYRRAGWAMPWLPTLCTLQESHQHLPQLARRRLTDCCDAAGVRLVGAHSSLGDARATAGLLASYLSGRRGSAGGYDELVAEARAVVWPAAATEEVVAVPERTRHQIRIARAAPRRSERLIDLLDELDLRALVVDGPLGATAYLELLAQVLEDGVVDDEEATALRELAIVYELPLAAVASLHRSFLLALAHKAVDDDMISRDERAELYAVADLLEVPRTDVLRVLDEAQQARHDAKSAGLPPLPADWGLGEPLRVGDAVAFTGCDDAQRSDLEARARKAGVKVAASVSARTAMLVTDGSFAGTKHEAAQRHGVRLVHPDVFATFLRHVQPRHEATKVEARPAKSTSSAAGRPTSPADVRAWAREVGVPVGERGRIPQEVFDAYSRAHQEAGNNQATEADIAEPTATGARPPLEPPAAKRAVAELPPPGWYPDSRSADLRWWDGQRWMEHRRPISGPAPGWYPRTDGSHGLRWWDGQQWTEHTRAAER